MGMIKPYRKKPVVIEAILLQHKDVDSILDWIGAQSRRLQLPDGKTVGILIKTPEGEMQANIGDYIIKGVKGEFYPCKSDIFDATYEALEDL